MIGNKLISKNQKFFLAIIFSFFNLFLVAPFVFSATVTISPATINANVNSQFTVTIQVTDVSNFFGAAFDLMFNPSVLSFVSAQKGTFLEQGGINTTLMTAVNPPGDLIVGYSREAVGGVPSGVSGSGNLMTLTFRAIGAGTSGLNFQNNSLCDATGSECNPIVATWNNAAVIVGSGYKSADLNKDGVVNSVDFGILMSFWNSTSRPAADINQDGIVNSVDFGIMMSQWG